MGVSDALKDNGKKTASKIIEAFYIGFMFLIIAYILNNPILRGVSYIHLFLSLGLMHQPIINVTWGLVRKGVKWHYLGTTSLVDRFFRWFIDEKIRVPRYKALRLYYIIILLVGIFVMYRNALIL